MRVEVTVHESGGHCTGEGRALEMGVVGAVEGGTAK